MIDEFTGDDVGVAVGTGELIGAGDVVAERVGTGVGVPAGTVERVGVGVGAGVIVGDAVDTGDATFGRFSFNDPQVFSTSESAAFSAVSTVKDQRHLVTIVAVASQQRPALVVGCQRAAS